MNINQFFVILLARKWIVLITLALTVALVGGLSLVWPKSYTATTTLVINSKGVDQISGTPVQATLLPGYMATQVDIISSHNVALKVVDKLGIPDNPQANEQFRAATEGKGNIRDWYADRLLANLKVEPSRESSVIELKYEGVDPRFVAMLANAFAESYIETNLQLKVEPSRQAAAWFDKQNKELRHGLEQAREKLSSFQREHGIVSVDERLDVESSRLAELSSQLVAAQAQTYDSLSRNQQLKGSKVSESPEVISNALIQTLKSQLVQAEAKLAEVSLRMQKNHPQYQAAQNEVDNLKARLDEEMGKLSSSVGQTARVSQQREAEIRAALSAQKTKVLALKEQHDEMAVLVREVENAQRLYDMAMQRYGQTSMEGQSSQTDISILNPAVEPLQPSSPKIMRNLLIATFLGTLLGIGLGFVVEILDRRIRSSEDITEGEKPIPWMGTVSSKAKPAKFDFLKFPLTWIGGLRNRHA